MTTHLATKIPPTPSTLNFSRFKLYQKIRNFENKIQKNFKRNSKVKSKYEKLKFDLIQLKLKYN